LDRHENSQAPPGAAGQRLAARVLTGCAPGGRGEEKCGIRGHPFFAPRGRPRRFLFSLHWSPSPAITTPIPAFPLDCSPTGNYLSAMAITRK